MMSTTTSTTANTPWILYAKPRPLARLRLFCFPYAGGGATTFRAWQDALPPSVEVLPVQLPGRGRRMAEPAFTRTRSLARALAQALRPYFDKPFAFFGHSMGALISFELARELRREHQPGPLQLFLSGRRAPQFPSTDAPTYDLPDAEFIEALRGLEGTPEEVLAQPELIQLMMPLLRADFELCETYAHEPEPPLACPISAYGGLQDAGVTREQLEGWREQTAGGFTLRMLPGGHFFVSTEEAALLRTLGQELHRVASAPV
jgi:medium-chain acyl-[acyl-carrier-protein] hydrolase